MIGSFSTSPKPQNNNAKIVMSIFFTLTVAALIVSSFIKEYVGIVQMLAACFLIAAILIYTKFLSSTFYYDVVGDGVDTPLFVVRQKTGKRETTLCRVELADIITVKKETRAERRAHKRDAGTSLYVYSPTLWPSVTYRVLVAGRHERAELVLEGTDELFEKITHLASIARSMRSEAEDE